jgi:zinc transport system substrate-binding protein
VRAGSRVRLRVRRDAGLALAALLLALGAAAIAGADAAATTAGAPTATAGAGAARVLVAASIPPLADFARRVGGVRVDVLTLVPPGASPHTYEPTPSQVAVVARARLLVVNGAGLEYWADKLVAAVASPRLEVVVASEGLPLLDAGAHGANPHVWLDPRLAIAEVARIGAALVRADPEGAPAYAANGAAFTRELERLDAEIAADVRSWTQRRFIAFHPAWVYFARRYGLEQSAVIERAPGREPSPAAIARIIDAARTIGARAIFAEPQLSPRAARAVAEETGARVLFLDPLGTSPERQDYVALMRYNVAQMAEAMR